jgi:hypothetical protein
MGEERRENFLCLGGHDNPLKRLKTDKGIQGNQSLFLGKIWLKLGLALLGFDKFGGNLAKQRYIVVVTVAPAG